MATEVDLNRWREAGKEIGRKIGVVEERERIIKLLEDYFQPEIAQHLLTADWHTYLDLIALIKGENK